MAAETALSAHRWNASTLLLPIQAASAQSIPLASPVIHSLCVFISLQKKKKNRLYFVGSASFPPLFLLSTRDEHDATQRQPLGTLHPALPSCSHATHHPKACSLPSLQGGVVSARLIAPLPVSHANHHRPSPQPFDRLGERMRPAAPSSPPAQNHATPILPSATFTAPGSLHASQRSTASGLTAYFWTNRSRKEARQKTKKNLKKK